VDVLVDVSLSYEGACSRIDP